MVFVTSRGPSLWERRQAPAVAGVKETPALAARRPGLAESGLLGRPEDGEAGVYEGWLWRIAAGLIEVR